MVKASDLMVLALEREGVSFVFGVPGEENLDFLDSVSRSKHIRFVTTRHEQSAAFMAATVGRLTGKVGVCLSTLGPGATNLVTGMAYGTLGGMAVLAITGQKPIKFSKQGSFQILNVVEMMHPVTKFAKQVVSGNLIPTLVRDAVRIAEEERPGAVHLELPEDVAKEDSADVGSLVFESKVRRPVAEEKAILAAVKAIEAAKSPVLLLGAGSNRKETNKMLAEFVEKTGMPHCCTQMGIGVLDHRGDKFIGTAAISSGDFVHRALDESDLIINVGHDTIEKPPFIMHPGGNRTVIHVNFYPAQVDPVYFPQMQVIGDVANAFWQLKEAIRPPAHWDWSRVLRFREPMLATIEPGRTNDAFPLAPERIVADLRNVLPDESHLCLDNGLYKLYVARNYPAARRNSVLLDNALATMGAMVGSAIACKLVHPDTPVIGIAGDGGFLMNGLQEIETAVRLHREGLIKNLVLCVLNDGSYGMIKWKNQDYPDPAFALKFGNPDFLLIAEAFGAHGHRVGAASELVPVLRKALDTDGVHLVDIPMSYDTAEAVLQGYKDAAQAAH